MPDIADRLKNIAISASVAMTQKARDLAAQGIDVVGLSTGEPDFPTPPHAIEAAYAAALAGDTRYPPTDGTPALRAAIQRKFRRDNGLDYDVSQIITTGGARQMIFNAMLATLNPGDEVVIPSPSWISYADIVKFAGATPVPVPCYEENGFKPLPGDIAAAITGKTKWLLLNYPSNPTGSVASREELQGIADVMLDNPHVWILTDDIYEHLIYDGCVFLTIAQVEPRLYDRVLTVNGVSKAYSMTGWRLGFCGGPAPLIKAMSNVNTQNAGDRHAGTGSGNCGAGWPTGSVERACGYLSRAARFRAGETGGNPRSGVPQAAGRVLSVRQYRGIYRESQRGRTAN